MPEEKKLEQQLLEQHPGSKSPNWILGLGLLILLAGLIYFAYIVSRSPLPPPPSPSKPPPAQTEGTTKKPGEGAVSVSEEAVAALEEELVGLQTATSEADLVDLEKEAEGL